MAAPKNDHKNEQSQPGSLSLSDKSSAKLYEDSYASFKNGCGKFNQAVTNTPFNYLLSWSNAGNSEIFFPVQYE